MAVKGKKSWIEVVALNPFNEQFIGETSVINPEDSFGRRLNLSMMNLTNDPKKQNIKIKFEITKKQGKGVGAEVVGYNMVASSIRRLVRRNINRIDASYTLRTKDNKKIQIKPFILTKGIAKGSVLKALRAATKKFTEGYVKESSYEKISGDILHHKLQNELRDILRKIYPVRICEIRSFELRKDKIKSTAVEEESAEESAEEQPEETSEASNEEPEEVSEEAEGSEKPEESEVSEERKK